MGFLAGLLIGFGAIVAAIAHLHQEAAHFWDFVAFACVTGGTIAVALVILPWQYRKDLFRALRLLIFSARRSDSKVVDNCVQFLTSAQTTQNPFTEKALDFADQILRDGHEMASLRFSKDRIHEILEERIHQRFERQQKISNSIRSLAKYPPAFGLTGTVLGLVSLMRAVSASTEAKQIGFLMAIALMATFYGLIVSNLLINPAGEYLYKIFLEERKHAEIALHSVLLYAEKTSLLEAQEVLNSYLASNQRVNLIGPAIAPEEAA